MNPDLSRKLIEAVDSMPAFPKSVHRILELTRDINSAPKDMVDVIEKDPVVTVKILKVVNSAYYSLPKQITSIGHSVVYLGFNTIKNLAISIAAIGILPKDNDSGFDIHQYLLHSLTTAGLARVLAARLPDVDPMDCFIAGLLHDFGKVVFAQMMPDEFRLALRTCHDTGQSLHSAMREIVGADHVVVGAMLVEKWRFAPHLIETIRHQHVDNFKDTDMVACVFAANQICKKLNFGFGGNLWFDEFPPGVQRKLGGSLEEVIASLGDMAPLYEEACMFASI
jgi:putative nucleotidyltransferase with HDIG domain